MKKISGIYAIINTVTDTFYVGQSQNILKRNSDERAALRKGKFENRYLQSSWNKHGEAAFLFVILLQDVSIKELTLLEQFYLDFCKAHYKVYNFGDCAECPARGRQFGKRQVPMSAEVRAKISAAHRGQNSYLFGRKYSDDERKILSDYQIKYMRPIERIDLITGEVKEYKNVKDAKREGFNEAHIRSCCSGRRASHRGYAWQDLTKSA